MIYPKGARGNPGESGYVGRPGLDGVDGYKGMKGAPGFPGIPGRRVRCTYGNQHHQKLASIEMPHDALVRAIAAHLKLFD